MFFANDSFYSVVLGWPNHLLDARIEEDGSLFELKGHIDRVKRIGDFAGLTFRLFRAREDLISDEAVYVAPGLARLRFGQLIVIDPFLHL